MVDRNRQAVGFRCETIEFSMEIADSGTGILLGHGGCGKTNTNRCENDLKFHRIYSAYFYNMLCYELKDRKFGSNKKANLSRLSFNHSGGSESLGKYAALL